MNKVVLMQNRIKSLLLQAEESGITAPFTAQDVDDCVAMEGEAQQMRCLSPLHHAVHELLFSPPRGG